jgi:hypothetical protein
MPEPAPSPASADRNLLFGILALQMDFVSRDALIRAMHAWVLDKHKPLGQILVEQGALRAATRAALEVVVQQHLEQHGNDPQQSLAAVGSFGSVRQELEQVADADLQASLAHVSAARPGEADFGVTCDYSAATPTSSGLRFRVLRPHARGGLGEVFVARDEELHREVGLKQIQDRYADDPPSRARFLAYTAHDGTTGRVVLANADGSEARFVAQHLHGGAEPRQRPRGLLRPLRW